MKESKIFLLFVLSVSMAMAQSPTLGGCPVFPSNNVWNVPITTMPVMANSAVVIADISASNVHIGIDDTMPVNVASSATTPLVSLIPGGANDPGTYLFPSNAQIEGGSDMHLLVVDSATCILYEGYQVQFSPNGVSNYSAAKWDLNSNALRTDGNTSADGAGLPITPGVLRYSDILAGQLNHALRVTVTPTQAGNYLWPARHYASHNSDPNAALFGMRVRLRGSFNISSFSATNQIILRGLQTYGAIFADNGITGLMEHDQDSRWNPADLLQLHNVPMSAFDIIDESSLESNTDSGLAVSPAPQGVLVTDLLGRPNSVALGAGVSIVNGTLTASGGGAGGATTISQVTGLQDALNSKQPLLAYIPEQVLSFVSPLVRTGNTITCPTCGTGTSSAALAHGTSPSSGSGLSQAFTFTFVNSAGSQNLTVMNVLFGTSLDARHACYVAFVPSSPTAGSLFLVDDAGDTGGPYQGLVLPGAGAVSNSQCTINGTGSSVSSSGTTVTLALAVTFTSAFSGSKIVYLSAQNKPGGISGWQARGTWAIPGVSATGPSVTGMTLGPKNNSIQTYTFTFSDTNGYQDIAIANVLVNNGIDGRQACYIAFAPTSASSGSLYLVDDAGDSSGPYQGTTLPGSGTVSNTSCAVGGAGSSVVGTGNTLTLTLPISFTHSFAGNQILFTAARSNTTTSNWQPVGTVTVQ